jgi:hypothetical protein
MFHRFLNRFYDFIDSLALWQVMAVLVVMLLLAQQGFIGRREALGGAELLDGRRWYTPVDAQALFNELGDQRYYYAVTELSLDLIFPITYGLAFSILILRTWGPRFDWMLYFPLATVVFDLLENLSITWLIFSFDGGTSAFTWFAAVSTLVKTILFIVSLVLVLNGGVIRMFRRL